MPLHSRTKPRRRKPPVRRRVGPGIAFAVVTGVLGVLISPVVLLVSIFRPKMRVGKRWVVSIALLTGICVCAAWAAASRIERWSADAVRILGAYDSARVQVRDLPFAEKVNFEGLRNGVDPCLVAAVMSQNSGFETDAVSWRGARGLMQLTPTVWQEFMPGVECRGDHAPPACSETCIYSVDANIRVGAAYLRYLIDAHQGDIVAALVAYDLSRDSGLDSLRSFGEPADPGESVNIDVGGAEGLGVGEQVGIGGVEGLGDPTGTDAGEPYELAEQPQGYVRSMIQAWVNYRGEYGRSRSALFVTAAAVRAGAGWAAVGLLCLLAVWAGVRYPSPDLPKTPGFDQDLQPGRQEECAGGNPDVATAGDACGFDSGSADGAAF